MSTPQSKTPKMQQRAMPEVFEALLKYCSDASAQQLWDWLDSTPDAVERMIKAVVDSHRTERKSY